MSSRKSNRGEDWLKLIRLLDVFETRVIVALRDDSRIVASEPGGEIRTQARLPN